MRVQVRPEVAERIAARLEEAELFESVFADGSDVAQVLMLLYVLTFNAAVDNRQTRIARTGRAANVPAKYPDTFLARLPVRHLLRVAGDSAGYFVDVYPSLVSLSSDPEMKKGLAHSRLCSHPQLRGPSAFQTLPRADTYAACPISTYIMVLL